MIVRKAKFRYLDYYQLVGKLNYNNNYLDNYLGGIIINLQDSYHDETSFWRPCVVGAQAAPSTKCSEEEVGEPW